MIDLANVPERIPSEPDPPASIKNVNWRHKKTTKWALSGYFSLKKLKGGFKAKREVKVEPIDD